jgi:hypothetical protein
VREHERPAFHEKLSELTQALKGPWPIPDGLLKHLWLAACGFDLATVRQACDDLAAHSEFFPKPVELKRACEAYGRLNPEDERPVRCLHLDYTRTPLLDDLHSTHGQAPERHWRCPAVFEFEPGQVYCPQHRPRYQSDSQPATAQEISEAFAEALEAHPDSAFLREVGAERVRRLADGEHPVTASLHALLGAIGHTMPNAQDSVAVAQARKAAQLDAARRAGMLSKGEN